MVNRIELFDCLAQAKKSGDTFPGNTASDIQFTGVGTAALV